MKKKYCYSIFSLIGHIAFGQMNDDIKFQINEAQFMVKTRLKENNCSDQKLIIVSDDSNYIQISPTFIENDSYNYQWYKNGEYILNSSSSSFQATETGYYSLKLVNKLNNSCEIKSVNSIPIYPKVNSLPITLTYSFDILSVDATFASKFEWYRDGIIINDLNKNNLRFPKNGTYKVRKYLQNSSLFQETNEVAIMQNDVLTIDKTIFLDDGDYCKPVPFLKAIFKKQEIQTDSKLRFQWYLNGKVIKDSTLCHFKPVSTGEYQVDVFLPDENNVYLSVKYKIVIEDFPKSMSIAKIEDICGAKALLKVDDSFMQRFTFQSIVWRVNDQEIPNETQPFYNATKSGFYTFSVKYLDKNSNTSCNYNSFVNFEKKTDFKLNLGYAYAGSGCVVDSFKIFTEKDKKYSYQWTRNDVPIKGQITNELFVKDKDRYKIYIKREDGCINETEEIALKGCSSNNSDKFILLNPPPIIVDKTNLYTNEKATLRLESCLDVNLQWFKDTKTMIGATENMIEVSESGNYTVQIEKFGCISTSNSIKIYVENVLAIGENLPAFIIDVYPNPTNEQLFISIPNQINGHVHAKLTDISGKLIDKFDFDQHSKSIDFRNRQEGIYLLILETEGTRIVKKIIKKD
ncbi:hypothetical protein EMA8858_00625 [Emticicia aquatica]|uniref:Secretion system C-terminal sorting domain-containing protein n=1 Tax=Emticicia aquatica TaxID=1681835 RepID=A0ABM9AL75_9BACT|nr:T9SS type A sorting domain-containing protein [Emticicia aquatica]CAH0994515.1 hypothetical protein EMA8858_00625 [Emticicia aquatica]